LIALTMLIGNLAALRQTNLKRMLAYSSIAHAGYLGLTILSSPATAWPAALYYLAIYTLMNTGALIVVNALSHTEAGPEISQLEGLGAHRPVLAAALGFLLISLAGIPPLAGFFGKYVVFASAIQSGYYGLVVLGALTSAASFYYYLQPIRAMYFKPSNSSSRALPDHARGPAKLALAITVLGIMILGTVPNLVYDAMSTVGQIVASR
jgi:NADH-quinone oxidoreductase subunit N